jgi:hypothetical protein
LISLRSNCQGKPLFGPFIQGGGPNGTPFHRQNMDFRSAAAGTKWISGLAFRRNRLFDFSFDFFAQFGVAWAEKAALYFSGEPYLNEEISNQHGGPGRQGLQRQLPVVSTNMVDPAGKDCKGNCPLCQPTW